MKVRKKRKRLLGTKRIIEKFDWKEICCHWFFFFHFSWKFFFFPFLFDSI